MGMSVIDLINYLRLEGPCDQHLLLTASQEDAPPPGDKSSIEGEIAEKEENLEKESSEDEEEPIGEQDPKEEPSKGEEEPMEEEDLEDELIETEEE